MSVVRTLLSTVADRIAIMYAGLVAEVGPVRDVVDYGWHPYTKALMGTVRGIDPATDVAVVAVEGNWPSAERRLDPDVRVGSAER